MIQSTDQVQTLQELGRQHLTEVIDYIKSVAPDVWEILVRQQTIEAVTVMASFVALAALFVVFATWAQRADADRNASDTAMAISFTGAIVFGIEAVITLAWSLASIPQLLNPAYYAIKDLLP